MKTRILLSFLGALGMSTAMAQAKKPLLMVVPSDVWMNTNGYANKVDVMGSTKLELDYERALQTDPDLNLAISKIGELMADQGSELVDLGQTIKALNTEATEDEIMDNAETMLEKLSKVAKCDIILQLTYTVTDGMRGRILSFNLQGLDAYTNKQVAAASNPASQPSNGIVAELLAEAAIDKLPKFQEDIERHFNNMFTTGREVMLRIKTDNASVVNLETEYGGDSLEEVIANWLHLNTVAHRFGSPDVGADGNHMTIPQVRIPMYGENGRALDTRNWARGLQKHLRTITGQNVKLMSRGLGTATLVIGAK